MRCSRIHRLLSEVQGGRLAEHHRSEVREHLARCPSCRTEAERLQSINQLLARVPAVEPPPFLITRTMARVRAEGQRASWALGEALKVRHLVPVAACSLLVLVLSAGILPRDGTMAMPTQPEDPLSCWTQVSPVNHGQVGVALTMEDMRAYQPVSSGEYLLALGALSPATTNLASAPATQDQVQITHVVDLEAGGRFESEITFADE